MAQKVPRSRWVLRPPREPKVLERSLERNVVLLDRDTGLRYVRIGWFAAFVRDQAGPGMPDAVLRAMPALGWSKRGTEGRIKATRPGFNEHLNFRFFVVPPGWEAE